MSDLVFRGQPGPTGLTLLTLQTKEFLFNIYSIIQCCSLEVNFFTLSHTKVEKAANRGQPKDSLVVLTYLGLEFESSLAMHLSWPQLSGLGEDQRSRRR